MAQILLNTSLHISIFSFVTPLKTFFANYFCVLMPVCTIGSALSSKVILIYFLLRMLCSLALLAYFTCFKCCHPVKFCLTFIKGRWLINHIRVSSVNRNSFIHRRHFNGLFLFVFLNLFPLQLPFHLFFIIHCYLFYSKRLKIKLL